MKDCDNSTRKIHISNNFILSISLQIMSDKRYRTTQVQKPQNFQKSVPLHERKKNLKFYTYQKNAHGFQLFSHTSSFNLF